MPTETPAQRTLHARVAAHAMHAQHDSKATTAAARATFLGQFLDEVDPRRELPEAERNRRALHARKRHFAAMAYRSSQARSRKAAAA